MSNQLNDPAPIPLPDRSSAPVRGARLRLLALDALPAHDGAFPVPAPSRIQERQLDSAVGPLALRSLRPSDAAAHAAFLEALGEQGRRVRAFALPGAPPAAGAGTAMRLVLAAAGENPAAGRLLGELLVGIDRGRVAAEFALAVRPDSRRRGLGRLLMACLLDACRLRRVILVCGSVPADGAAMLALARGCGFQALPAADGTVQLALMLRPRGVR